MKTKYLIAAFLGRDETMTFYNKLLSSGGRGVIINTPKRISESCGISVKFPSTYENLANRIISRTNFNGYLGIFNEQT